MNDSKSLFDKLIDYWIDLDKPKICCMNCKYYYATPDYSFCTIDKQEIHCEISHIVKCNAFSLWFGSM